MGRDPYLQWAARRGFRGYAPLAGAGGQPTLNLLLELDVAALQRERGARADAAVTGLARRHGAWVAPAHRRIRAGRDGRLPAFACISALVAADRVAALEAEPGVRRAVLSLPQDSRPEALQPGPVPAWRGRRAGGPGRGVIAIIDDLCPLLHAAYRHADGRSRWAFVWDQDVGVEPRQPGPWRRPAGFGYGREITAAGIGRVIAEHTLAGGGLDEAAAYAALAQPPRADPARSGRLAPPAGAWPAPRSSHGALCAALAAAPAPLGLPLHDAAAEADLVFVQLPSETVADTSGRGLAANVLDALRYVLDRVHPLAPLVVNLSYGAAAGPHDGSSVLETAIEQLQAERAGFAVVLPAGNLYPDASGLREDSRLHAALTLAPGERRELRWWLPAEAAADAYLELWPEPGRHAELEAALVPPLPCGPALHACIEAPASPLGLRTGTRGVVPRGMTLLAVAPTESTDGGPAAPAGLWRVRLRNRGAAPLSLHGWIERSDASFGGQGRQSFFPFEESAVSGQATLASISHGPGSIVVGGLRGQGEAAEVAPYSSSGPALAGSLQAGPDFSAPCEESAGQPGLVLPGFLSGEWVPGNGTSLAAPIAARRAFGALCAAPQGALPDAAELHRLLRALSGPAPAGEQALRRGPELALPTAPTSAEAAA